MSDCLCGIYDRLLCLVEAHDVALFGVVGNPCMTEFEQLFVASSEVALDGIISSAWLLGGNVAGAVAVLLAGCWCK